VHKEEVALGQITKANKNINFQNGLGGETPSQIMNFNLIRNEILIVLDCHTYVLREVRGHCPVQGDADYAG
jgi:hypothetical protein